MLRKLKIDRTVFFFSFEAQLQLSQYDVSEVGYPK